MCNDITEHKLYPEKHWKVRKISNAEVTFSNLLRIIFGSYSANTKYQCITNLKIKRNHTKAHHFYLLSTYNSEHIILISSQKNCTGTSVNQMTPKNKYKKVSKMKAKYQEKALQQ